MSQQSSITSPPNNDQPMQQQQQSHQPLSSQQQQLSQTTTLQQQQAQQPTSQQQQQRSTPNLNDANAVHVSTSHALVSSQPSIIARPPTLTMAQGQQGPITMTAQHQIRPSQLQGPNSGIPTQIRPSEYLVILAPNSRQPGVQNIRFPFIPIQRHQMMGTPGATILQRPALIRPGLGVHPTVLPAGQQYGIAGIPTAMTAPSPIMQQPNIIGSPSTAPSQMTSAEALIKGKNFFNKLLTEVKEKKAVLQNLIQALIDGTKTSAEFASALQRELNSVPQTQLVPFLELALPPLRQSLISGVTKLPGIRPPNMQGSLPTPQQGVPVTGGLPSTPSTSQEFSPTTQASLASGSSTAAKKKKVPLPPGQKSAYAIKKEAREARKRERELAAMNSKTEKPDEQLEAEKPAPKPRPEKSKGQNKQKKQEKQLESLSAALRDDDDVNDVAAMGGVNLAEESQKIMASGAELVGTQIRSCKDEPFLDTRVLTCKIAKIAKEHNLPEPSNDVVTIISHATQERLKDIVERLGVLAEHRSENLKVNPNYRVSNDIKGQMKFLAELDRIEKRRYEEQERELLLRVAKSRSKVEDPEQQKLRQKAKDMQRAEQEEVRQREANQTALLAIGPRKKVKTSSASSISSFSHVSSFRDPKVAIEPRIDTHMIRRVKRVNMKDLQVLLETDRAYLNRLVKISAL